MREMVYELARLRLAARFTRPALRLDDDYLLDLSLAGSAGASSTLPLFTTHLLK
jgi:hypothetical protein